MQRIDASVKLWLLAALMGVAFTVMASMAVNKLSVRKPKVDAGEAVAAMVRLSTQSGTPIRGGSASYRSQSWHDLGVTDADGQLAFEAHADEYSFRVSYRDATVTKRHHIGQDPVVRFQTVLVEVQAYYSDGQPVEGVPVTYHSVDWNNFGTTGSGGQSHLDLMPGQYTFRALIGDKQYTKVQNITRDPIVVFRGENNRPDRETEKAKVVVSLLDGSGRPLAGGSVAYHDGSWHGAGETDHHGQVQLDIGSGTYTFRMSYAGANFEKRQDVGRDAMVMFRTVPVTVRVNDATGAGIAGAAISYYFVNWQAFGTTGGDGTARQELLGAEYTFEARYEGLSERERQHVGLDAQVVMSLAELPEAVDTLPDPILAPTATPTLVATKVPTPTPSIQAPEDPDETGPAVPTVNTATPQPTPISGDQTPPTVSLDWPSDGAGLAGAIEVSGRAEDETCLESVGLSLNGVPLGSHLPYIWETSSQGDGTYRLTFSATDCAGNRAEDSVSVVIDNTAPAPPQFLAADSPGLGGPVGKVLLGGLAEDNVKLQFWVRSPSERSMSLADVLSADACGQWEYMYTYSEAGEYRFQLGAQDQAGNWSWGDEYVLSLSPGEQVSTLIIQQADGGYSGTADTWLSAWEPTRNFSDTASLKVRGESQESALIRFALDDARPDVYGVQMASLGLYIVERSRAEPLALGLFDMSRDWSEAQATYAQASDGQAWEQAGASGSQDRSLMPWGGSLAGTRRAWVTFDVTDLVQGWIADPASNQGLLVKGSGQAAAEYSFASSEHPDPCRRPILYVIYSASSPLTLAY